MFAPKLWTGVVVIVAFIGAACDASSAPATAPPSSTTDAGLMLLARTRSGGSLSSPAGPSRGRPTRLQTVLDEAVEKGTFTGVTATVIVADLGNWTGVAGSIEGAPLTPASRLPTHSAGKNIVAAQILRLAEEGRLALDDPAADHLPPELGFFDANGATVRQVLGMRSGIPDLNEYEGAGFYPAEQASTASEVFRMLPESGFARVPHPLCEHELRPARNDHRAGLGRPLSEALRSGVLAPRPRGAHLHGRGRVGRRRGGGWRRRPRLWPAGGMNCMGGSSFRTPRFER